MSIKVNNLSFSYNKNDKLVLDDISFNGENGKILAILGPNGIGKSTLMKASIGLLKSKIGDIYIDDINIKEMNALTRSAHYAYLSQENFSQAINVFDEILLGRRPFMKFGPSKIDYQIVNDIIHDLHLEELALRNVNTLSGGERKLVYIARAIAQSTSNILLDELTSNLDIKHVYEIMDVIKDISKKRNICIIIIVHDINLALKYADNYLLLKDSKIISSGEIKDLSKEQIDLAFDVNSKLIEIDNQKVFIL